MVHQFISYLDLLYFFYYQICGLKLLVNWLRGKPANPKVKVELVIKMLDKAIEFQGDITRGGRLR